MANKTIDAVAFCPFYICESRLTITCEGLIGKTTVNQFERETDKLYHEENFCTGKTCNGCGVFSALMTNYTMPLRQRKPNLRH